jgi:hypothetical protein
LAVTVMAPGAGAPPPSLPGRTIAVARPRYVFRLGPPNDDGSIGSPEPTYRRKYLISTICSLSYSPPYKPPYK